MVSSQNTTNNEETFFVHVCPNCNREFKTQTRYRTYCSKKCRDATHNKPKCQKCGRNLPNKSIPRKFCKSCNFHSGKYYVLDMDSWEWEEMENI